jgi:hypothetical protein
VAGTGTNNLYLDNFAVLTPRTLTYSLGAGAPTNASVNPATGVFAWTPTEAQSPATNSISVIVTDNSSPPMSHAQSFTITVVGRPSIQSVACSSTNATLIWSAVPGAKYRVRFKDDLNNTNWIDLVPDVTATGPTASIVDAPAVAQRFYRILVVN